MSTIEYHRLGATNIKVPVMGVGTLAWGDKRFGLGKSFTRDDLFEAYKACLDAGLNYFDTSDSYGKGMAEQLLGEFHREDGRPIIVGTKFTPFKLYDPMPNFSAKSIISALDASLKRLGLDSVDLYQIHYPVARRKLDTYLDVLAETVKSGKAKAIGVSNFNVDFLRHSQEYLAHHHNISLASNQINYSLLDRYPETSGMLAACQKLDTALIAILPLAEGVLTGKYRVGGAPYPSILPLMLRGSRLAETETPFRQRLIAKPYELHRDELEPLFQAMDVIAKTHKATIPQVALNWLIASNPLVIPIPGAKNIKQASDNAAAISWKMTHEEFEHLSQTEAAIRHSLKK